MGGIEREIPSEHALGSEKDLPLGHRIDLPNDIWGKARIAEVITRQGKSVATNTVLRRMR